MTRGSAVLTIPRRFNGPPDSAHGGYTCGLLAAQWTARHGGRAVVTLLAPPLLDTPLDIRAGDRRDSVWWGDELVATVTAARHRPPVVPPVDPATAAAASAGFPGRDRHPFPTCYVCGPLRRTTGLTLEPGPVPGRGGTVACPWVPRPDPGWSVDALVWSVLDCPSGWVTDPRRRPMVLTRMTADVLHPPDPEEVHVVVARREHAGERTVSTSSALYHRTGRLLACASAVWTALDGGPAAAGEPERGSAE